MQHIKLYEEFISEGNFTGEEEGRHAGNRIISESRKLISKKEIKLSMYKPKRDYFFEPIDKYSIRLHLTPSDAADSIQSLSDKFDVKRDGPGYYGSAYIIKHK
jgi:hypothetical protein